MRTAHRSKDIRMTAGIMGLMLLVFVLFSTFYMAAEVDHDCTGEDCPVCACIQMCGETLRGTGGGAAVQPSAILPVLVVLLAAGIFAVSISKETLVSQKVRLNN